MLQYIPRCILEVRRSPADIGRGLAAALHWIADPALKPKQVCFELAPSLVIWISGVTVGMVVAIAVD